MAIDEIPKDPARIRLEDIIACCVKRADRAAQKLEGARREAREAEDALEEARLHLSQWIEANPDPQPLLI